MDIGDFDLDELYNDGIQDFVQKAEYYQRKSNHLSVIFEWSDILMEYAPKLHDCGSFLEFSLDPEVSRVVLSRSNFCRVRFCPMCQWRRSRKLAIQLKKIWDALLSDGYDFLHVVLTVRNTGAKELPRCIDQMQAAYRNMLKDPALVAWKGAMRFLEVTYSEETDTYHPHFHSLVVVRKSYYHSRYYVKRDLLAYLWQQYLRSDYLPQVYISKADAQGVNEVSKYCVKPFSSEISDWHKEKEVYENLYAALHGRRMYQAFGVMCRYDRSLDALDADDAPGTRRVFALGYDYVHRRYVALPPHALSSS